MATRSRGPRRMVGFRWGRGDEIVMFRTNVRGRPSTAERKAQRPLCEPQDAAAATAPAMAKLSWDETPDELRRLVFVGHETFVALQRAPGASVRAASATLRSALASCCWQLEARTGRSALTTRLRLAAATWHLCELVLLDDGALVADELMAWAHAYFPRAASPEDAASRRLDARSRGSESAVFWEHILACAVDGSLLEAWTVLSLHRRVRAGGADDGVRRLFDDVRMLLLSMPRLQASNSSSGSGSGAAGVEESEHEASDVELWRAVAWDPQAGLGEFRARWTTWHESVVRFVREGEANLAGVAPELLLLLRVVSGDAELIAHLLRGPGDNWAHFMAALVLYFAPTCARSDLAALAAQWPAVDGRGDGGASAGPNSSANAMADASASAGEPLAPLAPLAAVLAGDAAGAVQLLHAEVGDRWVDAHLCDVLSRAGVLESVSVHNQGHGHGQGKGQGGSLGLGLGRGEEDAREDFLLGDLEVDMREHYLLLYAAQVGCGGRQSRRNAFCPGGWRVAADYLAAVQRKVRSPSGVAMPLGLLWMELVVDVQAPATEAFCLQLLRGCRAMGLPHDGLVRQRVMHWWTFRGGRRKYIDGGAGAAGAGAVRAGATRTGTGTGTGAGTGTGMDREPGRADFGGAANALLWAARSGDAGLASRLLGIIFDYSSLETLDLLVEHLSANFATLALAEAGSGGDRGSDSDRGSDRGAGSLNGQAMVFLAQYRALHETLARAAEADASTEDATAARDAAVQQLAGILDANANANVNASGDVSALADPVPKRFVAALLRKVLVEPTPRCRTPPCMTGRQAALFMRCLEDVRRRPWMCPGGDREAEAEAADLVDLHLVLVHALARAPIIAKALREV